MKTGAFLGVPSAFSNPKQRLRAQGLRQELNENFLEWVHNIPQGEQARKQM